MASRCNQGAHGQSESLAVGAPALQDRLPILVESSPCPWLGATRRCIFKVQNVPSGLSASH